MNRTSIRALAILAASTLTAFVSVLPAAARSEAVLANFMTNSTTIGYHPAALVIDSAGNLYGVNLQGGPYNSGTVFKLTPRSGGGWQPSILYAFNPAIGDGVGPATLVLDPSGHLFGVTNGGGANGDGTIFELIESSGGHWHEKVIYSFTDPYPSPLTLDAGGNIYGTVGYGPGPGSVSGYVFELTPSSSGHWSETTLYVFQTNGVNDGYQPYSGVTFDAAGNLYGTTYYGGSNCMTCGTVFELSPISGGGWTESVLHNFNNDGIDGHNPLAGVTFDSAGNLYGPTFGGGPNGIGVVYELTPSGGTWTETIVFDCGLQKDGYLPATALVPDTAGNLYGNTGFGGNPNDGVVYQLTPGAGGTWTYANYFVFNGANGSYPDAPGVFDASGNLYGTTQNGGAGGGGVIYGIKP
jgi:uncharacterized repeat protein (TIGR03803 family)